MTNNSQGYAVGWLTLAFINAGLAQGKGRRGKVWFLLSLLLGPVATFLIVVTEPGSRTTATTISPG
ncbi:MAG: antitermination protein NusB [Krumholzibacteria bacterium]|nr:antitermination protein NusB [Candidatus Krumholzibacteria bacterium]